MSATGHAFVRNRDRLPVQETGSPRALSVRECRLRASAISGETPAPVPKGAPATAAGVGQATSSILATSSSTPYPFAQSELTGSLGSLSCVRSMRTIRRQGGVAFASHRDRRRASGTRSTHN
jgi:hypothetical protein